MIPEACALGGELTGIFAVLGFGMPVSVVLLERVPW